MRRVQVVPKGEFPLYGAMVAKEAELSRKNKGTFRRSGKKQHNRAKWVHSSYPGWIKLARGMGEVVQIEVRSKKEGTEWQLVDAIVGFLDRHFSAHLQGVNIQYED
jgi:hypothetical protein